jgi:hypothetical protein
VHVHLDVFPVQIEEHGNKPESLGEGRGANGFPPTIGDLWQAMCRRNAG